MRGCLTALLVLVVLFMVLAGVPMLLAIVGVDVWGPFGHFAHRHAFGPGLGMSETVRWTTLAIPAFILLTLVPVLVVLLIGLNLVRRFTERGERKRANVARQESARASGDLRAGIAEMKRRVEALETILRDRVRKG